MSHVPHLALIAIITGCGADELEVWPCRSTDGVIETDYEYDAQFDVTHQIERTAGTTEVRREITSTFTDRIATDVRELGNAFTDEEGDPVDAYESTLTVELDGRDPIRSMRTFSSAGLSISNIETFTYVDGRMVSSDVKVEGDVTRMVHRTYTYPEAATQVTLSCDETGACERLTLVGGELVGDDTWTELRYDGDNDGADDLHELRELDSNDLVVLDEAYDIADDGSEKLLIRTTTTRRSYGAPEQEVIESDTDPTKTTTYAFCQ